MKRALPVLCVAAATTACDGGGAPKAPGPELIFDKDVRSAYQEMRPCRSPGEHSALNAFTVWVNETGAASFAAIWQSPPAVSELAEGSIVVKEIYQSDQCDPQTVERWVAMKKKAGFDPENGDWYWQEANAAGAVLSEGRNAGCTSCHLGSDATSCAGYGQRAGRDYLCTAP